MKTPHPGLPGSVRLAPAWHHAWNMDDHISFYLLRPRPLPLPLPLPGPRPGPFALNFI